MKMILKRIILLITTIDIKNHLGRILSLMRILLMRVINPLSISKNSQIFMYLLNLSFKKKTRSLKIFLRSLKASSLKKGNDGESL